MTSASEVNVVVRPATPVSLLVRLSHHRWSQPSGTIGLNQGVGFFHHTSSPSFSAALDARLSPASLDSKRLMARLCKRCGLLRWIEHADGFGHQCGTEIRV